MSRLGWASLGAGAGGIHDATEAKRKGVSITFGNKSRPGLVFSAILTVTVLSAACGEGAAPSAATTPQIGVTVNSVELAFASRALGPSLPVVVIDLTLESPSARDGSIRFAASQFQATDSTGRLYRPVTARGTKICDDPDYAEPALAYGGIRAGEAVRGRIVFAIEPGASLRQLAWDHGAGNAATIQLPTAKVACQP